MRIIQKRQPVKIEDVNRTSNLDDEISILNTEEQINRIALNNKFKAIEDIINTNVSNLSTEINRSKKAIDKFSSFDAKTFNNIERLDNNDRELSKFIVDETTLISNYLSWQTEQQAEIIRGNGQSGLFISRSYRDLNNEPESRSFLNNIAPAGLHIHSDYNNLLGMAEITAIVNGYYIRTRHNDYKLVRKNNINEVMTKTYTLDAPNVPSSITSLPVNDQINAMKDLFQQYNNGSFPQGFRFDLSYLEVWFEPLSELNKDYFFSDRHELENSTIKKDLEDNLFYNYTGYKNILENDMFNAPIIRFVNSNGKYEYARIFYRILGHSLENFGDIRPYLDKLDDLLSEYRSIIDFNNPSNKALRFERFKIKEEYGFDILDDVFSSIPGLDGYGAVINHNHPNYSTSAVLNKNNVNLNVAYYHRKFKLFNPDAVGLRVYEKGFNDPYLFTAFNTNPNVYGFKYNNSIYRVSYAIPLEIVLRTCLEKWNPYNIPYVNTFTGNGTQSNPYNGYNNSNRRFFITPDEFFDSNIESDPANTGVDPVWILDSNNIAKKVRSSGINIILPRISGTNFNTRIRYPVMPFYHEGNYSFAVSNLMNKIIVINDTREQLEKINSNFVAFSKMLEFDSVSSNDAKLDILKSIILQLTSQ